jgi:hypothetical protein
LRCGVRELAATLTLPFAGARVALRAIDRAIAAGETVHLAIDLPALAGQFKSVSRVLRHIALRREAGRLTSDTIAGLTQRVVAARQPHPTQSILRRAA